MSKYFAPLSLIGLFLALYLQSVDDQAFSDDYFFYTAEDSAFQTGFLDILSLTQTDILFPYRKQEAAMAAHTSSYRVIPNITHWVDYHWFGADFKWAHFHQLLWGLVFVLSLYFAVVAWTKSRKLGWLSAALFFCHPLMVESFVWVSARSELIAGSFLLLSWWVLAALGQQNTRKKVALALFTTCLVLAFLSKESAIVAVFVFPAFLFIKRDLAMLRPVILSSVAALFVGFLLRSIAVSMASSVIYWKGLLLVPAAWLQSLIELVLFVRPGPARPIELSFMLPGLLSILLLTGLSIYFSLSANKKRQALICLALVSIFLFLLPTFPILDLTQLIPDRYLLLGFSFFVVLGSVSLKEIRISSKHFLAGFFVIIVLASFSFRHIARWDDHLVLTKYLVASFPESSRAHRLYAVELNERGKTEHAIEGFEKAVELNPYSDRSWIALIDLLFKSAMYEKAEARVDQLLNLMPQSPAEVYFRQGVIKFQRNKPGEACRSLEIANKKRSNYQAAIQLMKQYCK